jgi:hypothetical protein
MRSGITIVSGLPCCRAQVGPDDREGRLQSYLRPSDGRQFALATMESRAWGAYRLHGPRGSRLLSARPHAGPPGLPSMSSQRSSWMGASRGGRGRGSCSRCDSGGKPWLEGPLIGPDSPSDPREFVGERDGGEVEALAAPEVEGPSPEIVGPVGDHAGS